MDTRRRVLVVEDEQSMRYSHVENLTREGYLVGDAESFDAARETIARMAYHAAVVDIRLGGNKNVRNRDGIKVLEELRRAGDGTQAIVVSRAWKEQTVRDFLKEHGAFDYLDKSELDSHGVTILFKMVQAAVAASTVARPLDWETLTDVLSVGTSGAFFVSDCLGRLECRFDSLKQNLLSAATDLVPLLVPRDTKRAMVFDRDRCVFAGIFWSKGQGKAVQLVLGGEGAAERLAADSPPGAELLHEAERHGVSVVVFGLNVLSPEGFVAANTA